MNKQYFKQAIHSIRENPLVSIISISGTALSIAMIMVVILLFQIRTASYEPESNRDRMMYVYGTQVKSKTQNNTNNGSMSAEVVRECFYSLTLPEEVTAFTYNTRPIYLPGKRMFKEYTVKYTDTGFWKIFDFRFLHGHAFDEADFSSGLPKAVIIDHLAKNLFGREDAVGETIILNHISYTVVGIVKEVSLAARDAYAHIWVPYSSSSFNNHHTYYEGMTGPFITIMLAGKRSDFGGIKDELDKVRAQYNSGKKDYEVSFMSGPITTMDKAMGANGYWMEADLKSFLLSTGSLVLFLLLVPALNITSVVHSSIRKRRAEIGLRKAFGATFRKLVSQILYENMVISCIGGLLGFIISFLLLYVSKGFLLNEDTIFTMGMLFKPMAFLAAFLFVILLNLLSAGVPAVRIARQTIVDALNENEK